MKVRNLDKGFQIGVQPHQSKNLCLDSLLSYLSPGRSSPGRPKLPKYCRRSLDCRMLEIVQNERLKLFKPRTTSLNYFIFLMLLTIQIAEFFNSFFPNVPFLYLLKTSENLRFSDVFRVYRERDVFRVYRERVHWEQMG